VTVTCVGWWRCGGTRLLSWTLRVRRVYLRHARDNGAYAGDAARTATAALPLVYGLATRLCYLAPSLLWFCSSFYAVMTVAGRYVRAAQQR